MSTLTEKREQLIHQCRVIRHLATNLALLYGDLGEIYGQGKEDERFVDMVGDRAARHMETLGDILNGMDAATHEDKWMDPVFKAAHQMWPQREQS